MRESMSSHGVELYGVTAETQESADASMVQWGVKVPLIGDLSNTIAKQTKEAHLSSLIITMAEEQSFHSKIGSRKVYPNGAVQPAVLFLSLNEAPVKPTTLFAWAVKPTVMTFGGAIGRPDIVEVWELIRKKILTCSDPAMRCVDSNDVRILGMWHMFCGERSMLKMALMFCFAGGLLALLLTSTTHAHALEQDTDL